MRLLLSRGLVIGLILLMAVAIPRAAAPPRHLAAEAASVAEAPIAAPESAPTPRWAQPREAAVASPPPAPTLRRVAIRLPATKVGPPVAARVVVGTGQWGLINQDRLAAGLAQLQWSTCLANVATGQATRMAAQGYISHANGRTLDLGCHLGSTTGENIGYQGGSINDPAMNAWFMGDPPHRANILGPYHYVGIAWVWGARNTAYLAVEFG